MLDVDRSVSQLGGGAVNAQTAGEQIATRRRVVNIVVEADINALLSMVLCTIVSIDLDVNDVCGEF